MSPDLVNAIAAAAPFGLLGLAGLLFVAPWPRLTAVLGLLGLGLAVWALTAVWFGSPNPNGVIGFAGWGEAVGGGLRLDGFSGVAGVLVCLFAAVSVLLGLEEGPASEAALRVAWAGAALAALFSVDLLGLVAWQVAADLALAATLALQPAPKASLALISGSQVFFWRSLCGGLGLLGLAILFAVAGRLDGPAVSAALFAAPGDGRATVGGALVLMALLGLAGAPPLHMAAAQTWMAVRGPSVMLLLGAQALGLAVLARALMLFLDADRANFLWAAVAAAALPALWTGLQALRGQTLLRIVAALLAVQVFGVLLGFALRSPEAALGQAGLTLLGGLSACLGADLLRRRFDTVRLEDLHGAGRWAPLEAASLVVGALSLAGAPFSAGFLGQLDLLAAAADAGAPWAAALLALTQLGCLIAALRLTLVLCASPSPRADAPPGKIAWASLPLGLAAAAACLVLGVAGRPAIADIPAAVLEHRP